MWYENIIFILYSNDITFMKMNELLSGFVDWLHINLYVLFNAKNLFLDECSSVILHVVEGYGSLCLSHLYSLES